MTDPAFQEQVLTTRDGRVALSVVPFGLTVHRLELRPHDAPVDVLVGPEEAKSHADGRAFFGSAVGRYANRLRAGKHEACLLYTSPSPRDRTRSRMPSSA